MQTIHNGRSVEVVSTEEVLQGDGTVRYLVTYSTTLPTGFPIVGAFMTDELDVFEPAVCDNCGGENHTPEQLAECIDSVSYYEPF